MPNYTETELKQIAAKVIATPRPADPTPHLPGKQKFFKVYKAPGYPIDPKMEKERQEPIHYVPMLPDCTKPLPTEAVHRIHSKLRELFGHDYVN